MDTNEFIQELQQALIEGQVSQSIINENIEYYRNYIRNEISNGKNESEVLDGLGSPRLIAKTIIDVAEQQVDSYSYSNLSGEECDNNGDIKGIYRADLNKWYYKAGFIAVFAIILFVLTQVLGFVITYAGPIFIILLIIYFFKRNR